jgi:hypothetical protein
MQVYRYQKDLVGVVKTWTSLQQQTALIPTEKTIETLLLSAKELGQTRTARALLSLFQTSPNTPYSLNETSFHLLLELSAKYGWEQDLELYLLDMINKGYAFDSNLYHSLLHVFQNFKQFKGLEKFKTFVEEHFPEVMEVKEVSESEKAFRLSLIP